MPSSWSVPAIFLLVLPAAPAIAFHVGEHAQATERAVAELQLCGRLPSPWSQDWTDAVVAADRDEDLNLFRKWSYYSHYYNPDHGLDQYRYDSSATVTESVAAIQANPDDVEVVNEMVGRIIHHVQDASVPAHVVPVAHWAVDGFETADLADYYASPISPAVCAGLGAVEPMRALHDNAEATLGALAGRLPLRREGAESEATWLGTFWVKGVGTSFGEYGSFGNNFGVPLFSASDDSAIEIDPAVFVAFKRARVEAAVRATEAVLLWANQARR